MIASFIFLIFNIVAVRAANQIFPRCTTMMYGLEGSIDVRGMLYNCSKHINLPLKVPSIYNNGTSGMYSPTIVNVQYELLNLVAVDDLTSTASLDILFRLKWTDPRWNVPDEMYNDLNPQSLQNGFDITRYVYDSGQILDMWLPNLYFWGVSDEKQFAEVIKLFTVNVMLVLLSIGPNI